MRKVITLLTAAVATAALVPTASPATSNALTGKVWVLTSLPGKPPLRGTEITSEFASGGKMSGATGCNQYSGTFAVSSSSFRVSATLASTRKACARAIEVQEAHSSRRSPPRAATA